MQDRRREASDLVRRRSKYSSGGHIAMKPGGRPSSYGAHPRMIIAPAIYMPGPTTQMATPLDRQVSISAPTKANPGQIRGLQRMEILFHGLHPSGVVGGPQTSTLAARQFRSDGTPIADEFQVGPLQSQLEPATPEQPSRPRPGRRHRQLELLQDHSPPGSRN
jgi:serine protease